MTKSLPAIIAEKRAIYDLLEKTNGELSQDLEAYLASVNYNLAVKADGYYEVLDVLEAECERLRARAREFANKAKTLDDVAERLKDRMKQAMIVLGTIIVEGNDYQFRLSKIENAKMIVNEQLLPTQYLQVKQIIEVDKDKIRADLKSGIDIPGVKQEPSYRLLPSIRKGDK